ncbi:hypothetical protein [Streptomyces sp. B27]|uniref:hypothetical protein n=1 Tax=Streptomyces sp. B27 TaxID=2485015 RepID=UPI000FDA92DA|nr:hypothetical protein [Streptomyces sp. B27]
MDDLTRMWISTIPALDPESREVILDLDQASADPAERMACLLLNRGHEGEDGVFYLRPDDLTARYERTGDRLTVTVSAHRDVLAHDLGPHGEELLGALDGLPLVASDGGEHVVLLRREISTGFVPAEQDGEAQPVLLVDHVGGPVGPAELSRLFESGEASIAVVNATWSPRGAAQRTSS